MSLTFTRWMHAALLAALGGAAAAPALPAPDLAAQAVRDALVSQPQPSTATRGATAAPAPRPAQAQPAARAVRPAPRPATPTVVRPVQTPAARPAPPQAARPVQPVRATQAARPAPAQPSAAARAAQARAQNIQRVQSQTARTTARTGRSAIVRATAYNSLAGQTDSTPFITATGTRTRPGVVALSRDMLRLFPYGTRITIEDLSGRSGNLFRGRVFIVEDTMAARLTGSLDVWMSSYNEAVRFGARQVRITAVR